MRVFRFNISIIIILFISFQSLFAQVSREAKPLAAPGTSNFAYPQSLFVDSKAGHIWVTDFDNNRVLRFDVSALTDVKDKIENSAPTGFYLGQNYPNPFNPTTNISFSSKYSGKASLIVYNLLGQKVAVLFNETIHSGTVYSVTFNAKNLPGGIYMYALTTPFGSEIKKMCLLK